MFRLKALLSNAEALRRNVYAPEAHRRRLACLLAVKGRNANITVSLSDARLGVLFSPRAAAVLVLHSALLGLLQAFFDNFQSDYRVQEATENRRVRDVEENADVFQLDVAALYQLQTSWVSRCVRGQLPDRPVLGCTGRLPFLCVPFI